MRTILDTSSGYGNARGGGDKYAISSAVSFMKELEYTRFRCRDGSRACDQDTGGCCNQVFVR